MKSKTVMMVASVIGMIFGIGYMLIPTTMLGFYGATTDAVGILLGRFFGGSMLGFAVLLWGARNAQESDARRAIELGLFVSFVVAFALSLISQLSGLMNVLGWGAVAVFLIFALAFGYLRFFKPGA